MNSRYVHIAALCFLGLLPISPSPTAVASQPIDQLCGYSSFSDLLDEGRKASTFLESQQDFDPAVFWASKPGLHKAALANMPAQNAALLNARPMQAAHFLWAAGVYEDFDKIQSRSPLRPIRENGVGQLGISEDQDCGSIECVNTFDFTIEVDANVAANMFSRFGEATARHDLVAILGHEFGHFLLNNYYLATHQYASPEDMFSKIDHLKFHLTVDAVSMTLSSIERRDFLETLIRSVSVAKTAIDVGDLQDRIRCFQDLP